MKKHYLPGITGLLAIVVLASTYVAIDQTSRQSVALVAKLEAKEGNVSVRPDDVALWRNAYGGHHFYDRDVISTGKNSKARILLFNGSLLEIGSESTVVLTVVKPKTPAHTLLLDLLAFNLKPTPEPKRGNRSSSQIAIKSNNQTYVIGKSSDIKIDNLLPGGFKLAGGSVEVMDTEGSKSEIIELPKVIKPDVKRNHLANLGILPRLQVAWPKDKRAFWMINSFKQLSSKTFAFAITQENSENGRDDFDLVLQIHGAKKKTLPLIAGTTKGSLITTLNMRELIDHCLVSEEKGIRRFRLKIQPGIVHKGGGQFFLTGNAIEISFSSLADLPEMGLYRLAGLSTKASTKTMQQPWYIEANAAGQQATRADIYVNGRQQLLALLPQIKASKNLSLASLGEKSPNSVALYFYRDEKMLGFQLSQHGPLSAKSNLWIKQLGANLIFRGEPRDLIAKVDIASRPRLLQTLRSIDSPAQIFVYHRHELVEIKTNILLQNQAGYELVLGAGQAFFRKKVALYRLNPGGPG